jgi:PST family polysaccharide transporter
VIATLAAAPLVIAMFYSPAFAPAVALLRWTCLGMALRVITWPMGFIILAKGEQRLFITIDLIWTVIHVGLAWACLRWYGLDGAGMAFLGAYACHAFIVYPLVRRLTGFRWTDGTWRSLRLFVILIAATFAACAILPPVAATVVGAAALVVGGLYSVRRLVQLAGAAVVPRALRPVLLRLRRGVGSHARD